MTPAGFPLPIHNMDQSQNPASAVKPSAPRVVSDPRIHLCLPVYNKIDVPFVQCLMGMLSSTTVIGWWDFLPGDSLVNRARNNLASRFLNGVPSQTDDGEQVTLQFEWMLFLDTDLVFDRTAVPMLYEVALRRGPGIYCGAYPIKQLEPKVVFNNMPGAVPDAEGIVDVREAGTGFMLIHRSVFQQMAEKFKAEIEFIPDTGTHTEVPQLGYDFFSVGVYTDPILNRRRFLSEDWYFCQRWRALGGKILMHTRISCGHIGQFQYPANPQDLVEIADRLRPKLQAMEKKKPLSVKVGPPAEFKPVPEHQVAVAATD